MKTTRKAEPGTRAGRRGVILPDDACPACGRMMLRRRGRLHTAVNGEKVAVAAVSHLKCPACGEVMLDLDEAQRLGMAAITAYRTKHGLLSAQEIRSIRERFGVTQAQLARLLGLGANTVSRWESDRNAQTAAMDVLLRLIRDLPGTIEWLRARVA